MQKFAQPINDLREKGLVWLFEIFKDPFFGIKARKKVTDWGDIKSYKILREV